MNTFASKAIEQLPDHLTPYVVEQRPELYTAIDHAAWRYIMRVSRAYFKDAAHPMYLRGLEATGISTDRIPLISEMDACLRKFGWRAIAVSGFIPPAVFLEFQSLGILPIACDMRTLEHLGYTPSPDIVHEAAGHSPIVADPSYRDYLRKYGIIADKAIFSDQDMRVYEAVRNLSDTKENPSSTKQDILNAEKEFEEAYKAVDHITEATYLSRMAWWTTEYGLVGPLDNPKIYGAGLLSSAGESFNCMKPEHQPGSAKRIPFSVECVEMPYDITRPQPQLFVTPDFETLSKALEELAASMAFKKGGSFGLERAKKARWVTTTKLDSGIEISGILTDFHTDYAGNPHYLKFRGPVHLSMDRKVLDGQDHHRHPDGFSSPIGKLKVFNKSLSKMTTIDLENAGFKNNQKGKLEWQFGATLVGRLKTTLPSTDANNPSNLVITFEDCTIEWQGKTLYQPEWGPFDCVCGESVVSVYGGAADRPAFMKAPGQYQAPILRAKTNLTKENSELNEIYKSIRTLRENRSKNSNSHDVIANAKNIHNRLKNIAMPYSNDWLSRLELLELVSNDSNSNGLDVEIKSELRTISNQKPELKDLIDRGLKEFIS